MKKLIPNLLTLLVAVGLIAYTGCGEADDPNAVDADGKDISEDFDDDNPEDDEPKNVPKPKEDPEDGDDPDPSGDE